MSALRPLTLALLILVSAKSLASPSWFDQSHEIFLTPKLRSLASNYQEFPLFWWNFVIVDGVVKDEDLEPLCLNLSADLSLGVQKIPCHFDLKSLKTLTADWLHDLPLRQPVPASKDLQNAMGQALLKASLPVGRDLVELLRLDPLDSLTDLRTRLERHMKMDLHLQRGFLRDADGRRVLLPVQFNFPPAQGDRTQRVLDALQSRCGKIPGCENLSLFGAHAATRENEARIRSDVDVVSLTGFLALLSLAALLLATKRSRLLNLVPFLFFSIGAAVGVTILVFGKIHGLTLAFGPGIIGLSMDYGIHSAFLDPQSKKTWRANWVGLQTTLVILIVLAFSSIPLLRQMMFFAAFGLAFNYLVFYLVLPRWPRLFAIEVYPFTHSRSRMMTALSLLFLLASPMLLLQPVQLEIQHLNFESLKTIELRQWFTKVSGTASPYIFIEDQDYPLVSAREHQEWASTQSIPFEGISSYLPPVQEQDENLASWHRRFCVDKYLPFSPMQKKFFQPFFASLACENLQPNDLKTKVPDYLKDFHSQGRFVSLFFPKTEAQAKALLEKYPGSSTPREIFAAFPQILYAELLWMVPFAFLGAFFFLWLHYRRWGWSLLAVVPFLTGVGCYALVITVFQLPFSFISLIGLLMVFGCSLDYGIFVMDFLLFRKGDQSGVWSALSLCAWATVAGFAPLVFARHPVLNDLGQALLWGTAGTYVGSLWGIPSVYGFWRRWRPE